MRLSILMDRLVDPLDIVYACVYCVFDDTCACVQGVCGMCTLVCWNPTFQRFLFALLTAAAAYHVVCITPCLKLSSSLLCGSHGATPVAQHVCVEHFYARVEIAYACV